AMVGMKGDHVPRARRIELGPRLAQLTQESLELVGLRPGMGAATGEGEQHDLGVGVGSVERVQLGRDYVGRRSFGGKVDRTMDSSEFSRLAREGADIHRLDDLSLIARVDGLDD